MTKKKFALRGKTNTFLLYRVHGKQTIDHFCSWFYWENRAKIKTKQNKKLKLILVRKKLYKQIYNT